MRLHNKVFATRKCSAIFPVISKSVVAVIVLEIAAGIVLGFICLQILPWLLLAVGLIGSGIVRGMWEVIQFCFVLGAVELMVSLAYDQWGLWGGLGSFIGIVGFGFWFVTRRKRQLARNAIVAASDARLDVPKDAFIRHDGNVVGLARPDHG